MGVQLQIVWHVFQVKILSRETPSFHRQDLLKNERDNEIELLCSMRITKYGKCEWDGLWSIKWIRWKWMKYLWDLKSLIWKSFLEEINRNEKCVSLKLWKML